MGIAPDLVGFNASSRMSSRMPAMRALLSGPWQRKQVSDMIGRISRLNFTGAAEATRTLKGTSSRLRRMIGTTWRET